MKAATIVDRLRDLPFDMVPALRVDIPAAKSSQNQSVEAIIAQDTPDYQFTVDLPLTDIYEILTSDPFFQHRAAFGIDRVYLESFELSSQESPRFFNVVFATINSKTSACLGVVSYGRLNLR